MSYSVTYPDNSSFFGCEKLCELFETKELAEERARTIKFYNLLDDIEYNKQFLGYNENEAVCALLEMTDDEREWAWCNSVHVFGGVVVAPVRQSAKIEF